MNLISQSSFETGKSYSEQTMNLAVEQNKIKVKEVFLYWEAG